MIIPTVFVSLFSFLGLLAWAWPMKPLHQPLSNPLLAKLATLMGDEYKKLKGVRKEIVFLNSELSTMNALLEELADRDEIGGDGLRY